MFKDYLPQHQVPTLFELDEPAFFTIEAPSSPEIGAITFAMGGGDGGGGDGGGEGGGGGGGEGGGEGG
jgi:hypothetical protein